MTLLIETLFSDPKIYFGTVLVVVVSIVLHELAHGYAAIWLGDKTPIHLGRMTPNPLVHMGPFSIFCLLVTGLAWGQMPVDPSRLRGRHGDAIVAFAGPATNILIAFVSLTALGLLFRYPIDVSDQHAHIVENTATILQLFGFYNVLLALFNLLPAPPLDGSAILASFNRSFADLVNDPDKAGITMVLFIVAIMLFRFISPDLINLAIRYVTIVAGHG